MQRGQWGLGIIGGACAAIVLGVAIVAPTADRGTGPAATPSDAILSGRNTLPGVSTTRTLVPVPVPAKPEEGQALPPTPDPEETPEAANQDPGTASETSTARD
jgi:hypothetical protein